jgi:hypothetical protein
MSLLPCSWWRLRSVSAALLQDPALSSIAPNLVPAQLLPSAIALNSIAWQAGAVAGRCLEAPPTRVSFALPYEASAVLFAIALGAMLIIRPIPRGNAGDSHPLRAVIEGLAYVRANKIVLGAITLDLFAVLLGGATAMLPVYARDILHVGSEGLGALRAAPSVGAALTALVLARRPLKRHVGTKMFACVAVFGLATIVFGESRVMWLSLASLFVLGAADMISVYVRSSLIQLHTPDAMRGRVSAVSASSSPLRTSLANSAPESPELCSGRWSRSWAAARSRGRHRHLRLGFPSLRRADRFVAPDEAVLADSPRKDAPEAELPADGRRSQSTSRER